MGMKFIFKMYYIYIYIYMFDWDCRISEYAHIIFK